jgi:anti-anti-sigma factor
MYITTHAIGNEVVVNLHGKLTGLDAGDVLEQAVNRLAFTGRRSIVLNLSDTSMMDAGGLGSLIGAYRASLRNGVTLRLAHIPRRVYQLIVLAGLSGVLESSRPACSVPAPSSFLSASERERPAG